MNTTSAEGLPNLPPLPEPRLRPYKHLDTVYYTAAQMKDYARAYGELCRRAAGPGDVVAWMRADRKDVRVGAQLRDNWKRDYTIPLYERPQSASPAEGRAVDFVAENHHDYWVIQVLCAGKPRHYSIRKSDAQLLELPHKDSPFVPVNWRDAITTPAAEQGEGA